MANADCENARRLLRLARINGFADLPMIATQVDIWCAANTASRSLTWPNRRTAKGLTGAWAYPNGRTATNSSGSWSYPNGRTAKSGTGTWMYPDGRTAKSASGQWHRPDGRGVTLEELLSWSCKQLGEDGCRALVREIGELSGDDRDLAVIELAWSAKA
jgi:hypothetical protein